MEPKFPVGTLVRDSIGSILKVVEVEGMWTRMKWVQKDGSLSAGILWLVPSHLEGYEAIEEEENNVREG